MLQLLFKTNLKCQGCIATITPVLNAEARIKRWNVDLTSPDRYLTVEAENISADDIILLLKKAGYEANLLTN